MTELFRSIASSPLFFYSNREGEVALWWADKLRINIELEYVGPNKDKLLDLRDDQLEEGMRLLAAAGMGDLVKNNKMLMFRPKVHTPEASADTI